MEVSYWKGLSKADNDKLTIHFLKKKKKKENTDRGNEADINFLDIDENF